MYSYRWIDINVDLYTNKYIVGGGLHFIFTAVLQIKEAENQMECLLKGATLNSTNVNRLTMALMLLSYDESIAVFDVFFSVDETDMEKRILKGKNLVFRKYQIDPQLNCMLYSSVCVWVFSLCSDFITV